jgi:hypothetical protein
MSDRKRGPLSGRSTRVSKIPRRRNVSFSAPELAAALSVPLLRGEDPTAFSQLVDAVVEAFNPLDAVEYIFAHEFAQDTWAITRCKRMKVETLNGALQMNAASAQLFTDDLFDFAVKVELAAKGKDQDQVSSAERQAAEAAALEQLKARCRARDAQDAARAFPTLAELDKLESALEVRRSNRLELFDFYRRQKLEEICARADEIIDGEYSEAEEAGNQDSASGGAMVQRRSPADGEHLANEEVESDSLVPAQCEPTSQVEGTVAGTSIDAAPTDRVGRGVGGPGNEHRRGQEKADGAVD